MKLAPDPDPAKYRTKRYMPNNFLWVQRSSSPLTNRTSKTTTDPQAAGTSHVVKRKLSKRNLSELAIRSSPKDCDGDSETQKLVQSNIKFVLANDLTKGSVAVKGKNVDVGAKKSDRIYRVVLGSR